MNYRPVPTILRPGRPSTLPVILVPLLHFLATHPAGWWESEEAQEAATHLASYATGPNNRWRHHFDLHAPLQDRTYALALPAYVLGALAAENPSYKGSPFGDVAADMSNAWDCSMPVQYGLWPTVELYARIGYSTPPQGPASAHASHHPRDTTVFFDEELAMAS